MSNWLMDTMLNGLAQDPRMYYYFYRQVDVVPGFGAPANEEVLECGLQNPPTHYAAGGHVFCGLPAGYWEETTVTTRDSTRWIPKNPSRCLPSRRSYRWTSIR